MGGNTKSLKELITACIVKLRKFLPDQYCPVLNNTSVQASETCI